MLPRTSLATAAFGFLAAALACSDARSVSGSSGSVGTTCTDCHGGVDNGTGAPPKDTLGRTDPSLPSVGAHTAHVQVGSLAPAFDCTACHPKPAEVNAPDHLDGIVQITFNPLATANGTLSPSYDRKGYGCATVYCHGAFSGGNADNVPVWTAGASQAACGTCHGDPSAVPSALPGAHARLASGSTNATCNVCHAETVRADGTVDVAGGMHVDGAVEVDPAAVHPAGWLDPTSADFHGLAASATYTPCLRCHATNAPAKVTTVICNGCHAIIGNPFP